LIDDLPPRRGRIVTGSPCRRRRILRQHDRFDLGELVGKVMRETLDRRRDIGAKTAGRIGVVLAGQQNQKTADELRPHARLGRHDAALAEAIAHGDVALVRAHRGENFSACGDVLPVAVELHGIGKPMAQRIAEARLEHRGHAVVEGQFEKCDRRAAHDRGRVVGAAVADDQNFLRRRHGQQSAITMAMFAPSL
jgi:NAD-dependent DNA ligase